MSARVVVIGFGLGLNQRLHHCDVIKKIPGLILHGIYDLDVNRCMEASEFYNVRTYLNIEEVLSDDEVNVITVATPSHNHAEVALRCLEAGKHVVVEKPMCLTTQEADALIETALRNGCILTVRYNRRWDGDFLTVKKLIENDTLGQILSLDSSMNTLIKPSNWRAQKNIGGGELYDWGSHLVDQVLQLIHSEPKSVFAFMDSRGWDVEVDTYDRLIIRFENGTVSVIETSNISWIPRPRWYILGEKGNLVYWKGKFQLRTSTEDRELPPQKGKEYEFYTNVSEVLNNGKQLIVKPVEARKVVAIIEAAIQSAQTGEVVQI